jgi:hypothetical protein
MDGQHQEHGDNYAYSSLEWPEFYDLWVERLFGAGPAEDATIFKDALLDLIDAIPPWRKFYSLRPRNWYGARHSRSFRHNSYADGCPSL